MNTTYDAQGYDVDGYNEDGYKRPNPHAARNGKIAGWLIALAIIIGTGALLHFQNTDIGAPEKPVLNHCFKNIDGSSAGCTHDVLVTR